jgi:hypothetical protein
MKIWHTNPVIGSDLDSGLVADMAAGKSALSRIGDMLARWGGADEHGDGCGCRVCDAGLCDGEWLAGQRDGRSR